MKQDRLLIGLLAGIGLIIIAALAIFFSRDARQSYLPEDTPEGIVHNYLMALDRSEYERAYAYLAETDTTPSQASFTSFAVQNETYRQRIGVQIQSVTVEEPDAYIRVSLIHFRTDPFGSEWNEPGVISLVKQNGAWKIADLPYPYWDYGWGEGKAPLR